MGSFSISCPGRRTVPLATAAAASWFCCAVILALILLSTGKENSALYEPSVQGNSLVDRPCDEIYVVGEGETLHTISDKCGDPFIVEENPHIQDPDDAFPGLVIKITPRPRNS